MPEDVLEEQPEINQVQDNSEAKAKKRKGKKKRVKEQASTEVADDGEDGEDAADDGVAVTEAEDQAAPAEDQAATAPAEAHEPAAKQLADEPASPAATVQPPGRPEGSPEPVAASPARPEPTTLPAASSSANSHAKPAATGEHTPVAASTPTKAEATSASPSVKEIMRQLRDVSREQTASPAPRPVGVTKSPAPTATTPSQQDAKAAAPAPVSIVQSPHDQRNTVNASALLKLGAFKLQPLKDFVVYDELVKLRLEDGIDPTRKQDYLNEEEFQKVFGMTREAFNAMPEWRRATFKKKVSLF